MRVEYDHRTKEGDQPSFFSKEDRLWCLYSTFEQAEEAMLNNHGDLFEFSYNLGLIEEVYVIGSGDDASLTYQGEKRWWYHAEYAKNDQAPFGMDGPVIKKIDCPQFFENTCNFWVG